jgi:thiosulfate/3-mercaptopyruvate sulfurtransferase
MKRILKSGCLGWAAAALVSAAGPQGLVTADWLHKRLRDPGVVILDTRPEVEYRKGHIPGAILVNTYDYLAESSPAGDRALQQKIAEIFGGVGVRPGDTVVLYENRLGTRAARGYWMLRYAGQPKAHILEGGLEAWRKKQLPVSTETPAARPATGFRVRPQRALLAGAQELGARLRDSKQVILDVRTRAEYDGTGGPSDCARQGRIPGAVWIEWTQFLSSDGSTFRSPEELRALLSKHGVTPDKEVVTYCHRGARAAAAWTVLDALGFRRSKNYLASWHDWAEKKDLPAER